MNHVTVQCVVPVKIHTHPMEFLWKFHGEEGGGVGVLTAKFLEAKYEHKVEFRGGKGGGCKTEIFHGGCRDIFCNYKMYKKMTPKKLICIS